MNELLYDLTEFCKDVNIKNFRDYVGTTDWKMYKSRSKKEHNEWLEALNEWLEIKIKEMIKYKKRAEKVLNDYKK